MPLYAKAIVLYLIIINVMSFLFCAYDKWASKRDRQRIPEKTLFLLSALGGSPVMFLTMRLIRHKTKHKRFMFGIPLILVLQIFLIIGLYYLTKEYIVL